MSHRFVQGSFERRTEGSFFYQAHRSSFPHIPYPLRSSQLYTHVELAKLERDWMKQKEFPVNLGSAWKGHFVNTKSIWLISTTNSASTACRLKPTPKLLQLLFKCAYLFFYSLSKLWCHRLCDENECEGNSWSVKRWVTTRKKLACSGLIVRRWSS